MLRLVRVPSGCQAPSPVTVTGHRHGRHAPSRRRHAEESRNVIGGVAYPADKYGKVIYEAA